VLPVAIVGDHCDLNESLSLLAARGIQQVLVEAGPRLTAAILQANLADEVRIYIAPMILGSKGTADLSEPMKALTTLLQLKDVQIDTLDTDIRIHGLL
jgi:diaminohydroxyphosphoribosylaminopyrimidine deaminase/5-amino-6-(5-phosphoribosylamino)uracil reductase